MAADRASAHAVFGACALVFAAGLAATLAACAAMPATAGTPMAGGWILPMAWSPMCGQGWPAAAAGFLGMWVAMTAAMMTPSVAPVLWRHRQAASRTDHARAGRLTALTALGYALVWTAAGLAVFALGAALAAAELRLPALSRSAPLAGGGVVLSCSSPPGKRACWPAAARPPVPPAPSRPAPARPSSAACASASTAAAAAPARPRSCSSPGSWTRAPWP
jgi:predicted metal-binding membrane protein